jgi:hypothetical protein
MLSGAGGVSTGGNFVSGVGGVGSAGGASFCGGGGSAAACCGGSVVRSLGGVTPSGTFVFSFGLGFSVGVGATGGTPRRAAG